jgi:phospholipase D1/2
MYWQLQSICRGEKSILKVLKNEFPDTDLEEYISFFSMRNYGWIDKDKPTTEQIYCHSKYLIVDDKYAIIGIYSFI